MSPQITRKSSADHKTTPAGAPEGVLLDAAGHPVPRAEPLSRAVRGLFAPTHGLAPQALPLPPEGLLDLGPAAALRVAGPEREAWLQGVQTNDLRPVPEGGAFEALFLGGRGRIVATAVVFRLAGELVICTEPGSLDVLHQHLDGLLIMEDAELSRAEGLRRLRYLPSERPPGAPGLEDPATALAEGHELLVSEARARELLAAIPERPAAEALEARRIALGIPRFGVDFDEAATPLEAGLDRAISFDKGCYVGQEVVAMATFRGRVQWNLVRLELQGAAPAPGTALDPKRGGKGRVTSSAQVGDRALFLGVVHRDLIVPGSRVALAAGGEATVIGLPYGSRPGAGVCA